MGGGLFCLIGDTRGGSTGGGADSDDDDNDDEETEAGGKKTGTGGTLFGDMMLDAADSDMLDVRLAGELTELVDGEKGEEGIGEGGTDSADRTNSDAVTGGGAANELLELRVTTMGGGGGGTLDMRPCFLRYDMCSVPILPARINSGLGFV